MLDKSVCVESSTRQKQKKQALIIQEEPKHQAAPYANYPLDTEPICTAEQRLQWLQLRLTRQGSVRSAYRSLSAWSAYSVYIMLRLSWFFSIRVSITNCVLCLVVYLFRSKGEGKKKMKKWMYKSNKKKNKYFVDSFCVAIITYNNHLKVIGFVLVFQVCGVSLVCIL